METAAFALGASVRIKTTAPETYRPGALAAVVGIERVLVDERAQALDVPIGSTVYTVEFSDGSSCELAGQWLESAPD